MYMAVPCILEASMAHNMSETTLFHPYSLIELILESRVSLAWTKLSCVCFRSLNRWLVEIFRNEVSQV